MRRLLLSLCAVVLVPVAMYSAPASAAPTLMAGAAVVDDTWHVGAGSGQYAEDGSPVANAVIGGDTDPHLHSTKSVPSYGVQSRLTARAIVLQGSNGERVALVKTDNYLAQDLLVRRVAQLLGEAGSRVTYDRILYGVTHDHSSPYYATPAAGVWIFQDAVDLREFEYQARAVARAITLAESRMKPARMGATTVPFSVYKGNIVGPDRGNDGTPAGYPDKEGDNELVVMSFTALDGDPIATWMNWGQHPESLEEYNLISADYVGTLERYVDRETGAPLVFSQGDVGSAEGPYYRSGFERLPDGVVRAWAHIGFAQMERGARYVADAVLSGIAELRAGGGAVPYSSDVPVAVYDRWTTGPLSHPYPSVSNCRTQPTVDGDPGAPVAGMPDCERGDAPTAGMVPVWENLKAHGIPVPDSYDAPSFGAVEENLRLKLQAVRIGEVLLASCACEAQVDIIKNLESRADKVQGNIYDGYDWAAQCEQSADKATWTCPDPPSRGAGTLVVSDKAYQRFKAQIHNDARGWESPENLTQAMSEPDNPAEIFGNFTKEELPANLGYTIAVGIGHAGDYNGYTVSYREYQSRESYRKALTSYGPHTADYMATRLVRMAGFLKGGPDLADEPTAALGIADEQRQQAVALALGRASKAAYEAYEATLADDVGPAAVVTAPKDITRFDGTYVSWRGGSNAVDVPSVRVERLAGESWVPYADQTGEIPVQLALPSGVDGLAEARTGSREWVWTAAFEAYSGFPARLGQTPAGTYRFVVDGVMRSGGANEPYHLVAPFTVSPWRGVTVSDVRAEADGRVSFVVDAVKYPRTYTSPFRYIRDDGDKNLCRTCTFRPWASTATVASAVLTVVRDHGVARTVEATFADGRWWADAGLKKGETAYVAPGGVRDANGETNGAASATVAGRER